MSDQGELIAGRYRLESRLGSGAMGVVWKANDERLNRTVAVKQLILKPSLSDADVETTKRRAMREGRITARLAHAHAIAVYDVVEHDERPCLVMEYLESESLQAVLARGVLPVPEVAKLGGQIAWALAAAHDAGIVHRDVKPANVLVSEKTNKITDFGISRALGDASTTGVLAGTPAYLAPEVAQGGPADFHTDVFSLGSTLYAALQGEPPFGLGENSIALLHRVAAGEFAPAERAGALAPVLERLLATDPGQRPTMRQAHQALEAVANGQPLAASFTAVPAAAPAVRAEPSTSTSTSPGRPPEPEKRRGYVLPAALGVVLLVVLGYLAFAVIQPEQSTRAAPPAPAPAPAPAQPTPEPVRETPVSALTDYYDLMPENLDVAWQRLTPNYRASHVRSFDAFKSFWSEISDVSISDVRQQGSTVDATITYSYAKGKTVQEKTSYGLVQEGPTWKIDSSSVTSSTTKGS